MTKGLTTNKPEAILKSMFLELLGFVDKKRLKIIKKVDTYENISEMVYSNLISSLQEINLSNIKNIKISQIEETSKILRLLSPGFLFKNKYSVSLHLILKVHELIDRIFSSNIKERKDAEVLIPLLGAYTKILNSLIYTRQIKIIEDNFNQNNINNNLLEAFISNNTKDKIINSASMKGLKNHEYIEVKYLCRYITHAIEKLSQTGHNTYDNIYMDNDNLIFENRGPLHFIESNPFYMVPIKYNHTFDKIRIATKNFKNQCPYENAIVISEIILSAKNMETLLSLLEDIQSYYKLEKNPNWDISWTILKGLITEASRYEEVTIIKPCIDFIGEIASNLRNSKETRDIAIEVLVSGYFLNNRQLKNIANNKIREIYTTLPKTFTDEAKEENETHRHFEKDYKKEEEHATKRANLLIELNDIADKLKVLKNDFQTADKNCKINIIEKVKILKQKFDLIKTDLIVLDEIKHENTNKHSSSDFKKDIDGKKKSLVSKTSSNIFKAINNNPT